MNVTCCTAGVRVDLVGVEGDVIDLLTSVAADLIVDSREPPAVRVGIDDVTLPPDADPEQAVARWLHALHVAALAHTPTMPIHAAAVAGPSGCVVLPGPSGAGKSTLAAAALQSGLTLLSDEAACFTAPTGTVLPHARPLKLSLPSRHLLGVSNPLDPDAEIALPAGAFGVAAHPTSRHRCLGVVLPVREHGRSATLQSISPAVALGTLARCRLAGDGRTWDAERAWAYLSELVSLVQLAALGYDDPHEAAVVLRTWLS